MIDPLRSIRQLVWLYFWLLLFEGALRKWIVPGLSTPLLIVRDPVVIGIYALALRERLFPSSWLLAATIGLAVLSFAASLAGEGTLPIYIYGLRANFLHLPLILVLPQVLRAEDVRRLGFALLAVLPLMMVLAVLQFEGGEDSRWNVGAGGEIGGQLFAVEGRRRASGTFSFSTGFATYLALCTAFLLNDLLARRIYPRWLVLAAAPALVLSVVVSASRTAVISVAVVCAMVLYIGLRQPGRFGRVVRPVLLTLVAIAALSAFTPLFDEGMKVHRQRFDAGGGVREGLVYRYAQEFVAAWNALLRAPILGVGLGLGTSAGANMLHGVASFGLGEGEWERVIMESGPIFGAGYIVLRGAFFVVVVQGALAAYRAAQALPLLLVGVIGIDLLTGQFGQPTALGFAVFSAGLALAAVPAPGISTQSSAPVETRQPGRSAYAERLHGGSPE